MNEAKVKDMAIQSTPKRQLQLLLLFICAVICAIIYLPNTCTCWKLRRIFRQYFNFDCFSVAICSLSYNVYRKHRWWCHTL